jgi:hypothetical protein
LILLEYGSPEDAHGRAQHMLMSTIPVPAVVVAAVDVIAVMTIALFYYSRAPASSVLPAPAAAAVSSAMVLGLF